MSVEKKIRDILEGKKEAEKLAESAIENKKDETISEEQTEVVAEEKKEEVSSDSQLDEKKHYKEEDEMPTQLKKKEDEASDEEESEEEDEDEEEKAKKEMPMKEETSIDVSADVEALVSGQDLSEDFKAKAKVILETAVKAKLAEETAKLDEEYNNKLIEEVQTIKSELTEKVDSYLNYVVEQWNKDNQLAIERGIRTELAEEFISGLKGLFQEHYIEVPEDKYDVLADQADKITALEKKLQEQVDANVSLNQQVGSLKREDLIKQVGSGLADTDFEKLKGLAEHVDFTDEQSFVKQIETLKESYFTKQAAKSSVVEENHGQSAIEESNSVISAYAAAITRKKSY